MDDGFSSVLMEACKRCDFVPANEDDLMLNAHQVLCAVHNATDPSEDELIAAFGLYAALLVEGSVATQHPYFSKIDTLVAGILARVSKP